MFVCSLTSHSRIVCSYGIVKLQNLALCSALILYKAFKDGGIFIVPHLLCHGASVFVASLKNCPYFVSFLRQASGAENLFPVSYTHLTLPTICSV